MGKRDHSEIEDGVLRWIKGGQSSWHLSFHGLPDVLCGLPQAGIADGVQERPLGDFIPITRCHICQDRVKNLLGLSQ